MHEHSSGTYFLRLFMNRDNKSGLFLGSPHPYLCFSYSLRPMGDSAHFLFATMDIAVVTIDLNNHKFMHPKPGACNFSPFVGQSPHWNEHFDKTRAIFGRCTGTKKRARFRRH